MKGGKKKKKDDALFYVGPKMEPASALAGFISGVAVTLIVMGVVLYFTNQFIDVL